MPSSDHSPSTSSTGTTAAPVTTRRRVERSNSLRSGWSRMDWKMVGGPGSTEIRSLSIRPTSTVDVEDRFGDHGGPGHQAGQDARLVSEGVEERVDDQVAVAPAQPHHLGPGGEGPQRLAVGGHGPLGTPGGPRGEHQVGEVAGGDRGRSAGGHVGRARALPLGGRPPTRRPDRPWPSAGLGDRRRRRGGPPPARGRAPVPVGHRLVQQSPGSRCRGIPSTVKSSRAPDWRRMYAASAPLNRVLRGTSRAPAPTAPSAATTHSAQLGAQMATRSPRSIPLATMARVAAATSSASWSKVSRMVVPAGRGRRPPPPTHRSGRRRPRPGRGSSPTADPRGDRSHLTRRQGSASPRAPGWPGPPGRASAAPRSGVLAAHRHHLAGHEGGVLTGQEDDDVGHLPHLGAPPEHLTPAQLGQLLVGHDLVEERVDGQAGDTALMRMLWGAASTALHRVSAITPALAAA